MNRRSFLKFLGGAAATAVVVPKVSYFFAPQGGWTQGKGGLWAMNCPPRCPQHLHLWQVQEVMERVRSRDMDTQERRLDATLEKLGYHWNEQRNTMDIHVGGRVSSSQLDGGNFFQGVGTAPVMSRKQWRDWARERQRA